MATINTTTSESSGASIQFLVLSLDTSEFSYDSCLCRFSTVPNQSESLEFISVLHFQILDLWCSDSNTGKRSLVVQRPKHSVHPPSFHINSKQQKMEDASPYDMKPSALTMDRLDEKEDLIVAQSTSQCCRCCCFQPSINWVLAEQDNFEPGQDPFDLDSSGWVHEESSFCGRWWSWALPGCRAQKYVQHSGPAPASIRTENGFLSCQTGSTTVGLSEDDRRGDIVATHEKNCTCGTCYQFVPPFPICCNLPYLETKDSNGSTIGKTSYVCDACLFVPKYDVTNAQGEKIYRIRPDTCVGGMCVQCRCGGGGGKCCRVPFVVRNPDTLEPVATKGNASVSQVDALWTGWANECCRLKNAYHLAFPDGATAQEKLILTGASILIDTTVFEQQDDSSYG